MNQGPSTIATRPAQIEPFPAFNQRTLSARISRRLARNSSNNQSNSMTDAKEEHDMSSDEDDEKGKGSAKSRRELPSGAVSTLKAWLLSPDHFTHPYPTPQDQIMLMQKTGIDKKQLKNWFTNARRRIWKPMLKKQIDQGKLTATGGGGGGVAVVGPGLMMQVPGTASAVLHTGEAENVPSAHTVHAHYQQAGQQQPTQPQQQPQQYDQFGNPIFVIPQQIQQQQQQQQQQPLSQNDYSQQFYQPQQQYAEQQQHQIANMGTSGSIGSLPPMGSSGTISTNISAPSMNKTDSHAVLMELFARDQDLVRQATESAKMKKATSGINTDQQSQSSLGQFGNQHPMKMGSQSKLTSVPSMNSWPHFSSISSLNNLGSMTGVKSITSMSGFDLASQGNLNKMGNLAQVKSMESMGKNDSYAFLEVFFGDRSMSSVNMAAGGKDSSRGVKRDREEDNDVGLSLDADETPPTSKSHLDLGPARALGAPAPAPLPSKDPMVDTGTLKRAYDDALAARGLMSVSRSSENLSDLALPAKMQRTLSQQYLRQHQAQAQAAQQQQQQQQQQVQHSYAKFVYPPANTMQAVQVADATAAQGAAPSSQQYPGQHPQQQQQQQQQTPVQYFQLHNVQTPASDAAGEVQVPSASTCGRCHATGVDTQLRPCGHMFHERCLKPTLQVPAGQPKCPIDNIPIQSALLAVPTDETKQQQQQQAWCEGVSAPKYNPAVSAESSSTTA